MNIKFIDDLILDIYIKKKLIDNIDFNSKENLEDYLKNLFKILKNKYRITIEGFYDITVYIDKYYGIVLHLEKEDIDYYDYYKDMFSRINSYTAQGKDYVLIIEKIIRVTNEDFLDISLNLVVTSKALKTPVYNIIEAYSEMSESESEVYYIEEEFEQIKELLKK